MQQIEQLIIFTAINLIMMNKVLRIIEIIGYLIGKLILLIGILFFWLYPMVRLEPFYDQISGFLFVVSLIIHVFIMIGFCIGFMYIWEYIICKYIQNKFNEFRDNLINE